jgi:hypothetical protein
LFNEHKAYEANYKRKLKAYQHPYLKFRHESPFAILENNLDIG